MINFKMLAKLIIMSLNKTYATLLLSDNEKNMRLNLISKNLDFQFLVDLHFSGCFKHLWIILGKCQSIFFSYVKNFVVSM